MTHHKTNGDFAVFVKFFWFLQVMKWPEAGIRTGGNALETPIQPHR